ncbi:hypothetical protein DV495_003277 [Geotrichum candidum]|nr:hypothetical protein DV452_002314 [Geotrichum candidum]KAF5126723.1 hypothetical protein DV495_003277 [Geotrichum candidum]KAF7496776.1 hypothetical protein DV113_005193 [Geotrichum candidum]KAI8133554.1 hypothetical protein DUD61_002774 [Geotrichum candidum]KAI9210577.1 hypothetical protein DS838_004549 [Geotrichum bryndzae]
MYFPTTIAYAHLLTRLCTSVGRPKHTRIMAGALEGDNFIGSVAQKHRGLLKIKYPMEHGTVTDWDDMERIWQYVYSDELRILSEEHPVLLTEAPLNPRANREQAAQVFFETFNVPALYLSIQAVLALYASGRTTGLVLDSGDGVTHAVSVYSGFAIPSAVQRIDIAGRDVTEHLQLLLRKSGVLLQTSAEKEIVREIKERHCYLAVDPRKEEKDWAVMGMHSSFIDRPVTASDSASGAAGASGNTGNASGASGASSAAGDIFRLPDGRELRLGAERFRSAEILFSPHIIGSEFNGVHQIIADSISRTDLDLRSDLYENIVLSGGSTLAKGFGDRLLAELRVLAPRNTKIKIYAPPERKYSTWIGGSILAGLSTFKKMWVSADEWHENPDIIHTKCM